MLPHLNVLLKRSDGQLDVVFFNTGNVASPVEEGQVFILTNLKRRHLLVPFRSPRDFERLVLRVTNILLAQKLVDNSVGNTKVTVFAIDRNDCGAFNNLGSSSFGFEFLLGHVGHLHELLQTVLFEYTFELIGGLW